VRIYYRCARSPERIRVRKQQIDLFDNCPVPGRDDFVQVSVSDTGRGIPKGQEDCIFDRLYQIKTGDATNGHGIGLGLYLCRELVWLHGSVIWVKSEPNKGSVFKPARSTRIRWQDPNPRKMPGLHTANAEPGVARGGVTSPLAWTAVRRAGLPQ